MHKLVILIESMEDMAGFDEAWPQFLHLVESMPGLRRESTSRVEVFLYGKHTYDLMHELYFDSLEAAQQAMVSPQGGQAGRFLQAMTGGRVILFFADHKEDDLDNIRRYGQPIKSGSDAGD